MRGDRNEETLIARAHILHFWCHLSVSVDIFFFFDHFNDFILKVSEEMRSHVDEKKQTTNHIQKH